MKHQKLILILLTFILSSCGDFWYTDIHPRETVNTANPNTNNPPNTPDDDDPVLPAVKAWHHPQSLSDNISLNNQDASLPKVAMDDNGNIIVVWYQFDGSKNQIFKSEFRNGTWTHPTSLSDNISPDGQYAYFPDVDMDNNGNAIIAWHQYDGVAYQIFKSEYRNGVWTHPTSISDNISPDGQNTYSAQVAMSDNGDAIITWYQADGAFNQIYKSEYRNGVWTHPASLSDNISPNNQQSNANEVAMDDSGNTIIVWHQSNGTHNQIFKSEFRNGAWTHPANLSNNISPDSQSATLPQVAMDNLGNAVIAWNQSNGLHTQIFKSEYRNNAWTHPVSVINNISPDGLNADTTSVAMDDLGNALITWRQTDGVNSAIFKSEYRNGIWTHPANLADNVFLAGQYVSWPSVSMDNLGNALITWEQIDGIDISIYKSEYRNGAWTQPTGLSDHISASGTNASSARSAMSDHGTAAIVWMQDDGSFDQIFMSEFK